MTVILGGDRLQFPFRSMKTAGIVYHPKNRTAPEIIDRIKTLFDGLGMDFWTTSAWKEDEIRRYIPSTDLVVTVGGDGTILRAAHSVIPHSTLITGVNVGRVGFLTEIWTGDLEEKLPAIARGEYWIDSRAVLEAELVLAGETGECSSQTFFALNDVVVARGEVARIIHVEARVDDEIVTTYRADGVIISTPTGSTGYAMAAGGPVMYPQAQDFILVPILSHLSPDYALVLPGNSTVELRLSNSHLATLNIDGHISLSLPDGAIVKVKKSSHKILFARNLPRTGFFGTLEKRLKIQDG